MGKKGESTFWLTVIKMPSSARRRNSRPGRGCWFRPCFTSITSLSSALCPCVDCWLDYSRLLELGISRLFLCLAPSHNGGCWTNWTSCCCCSIHVINWNADYLSICLVSCSLALSYYLSSFLWSRLLVVIENLGEEKVLWAGHLGAAAVPGRI
jgi:hypothetical protein